MGQKGFFDVERPASFRGPRMLCQMRSVSILFKPFFMPSFSRRDTWWHPVSLTEVYWCSAKATTQQPWSHFQLVCYMLNSCKSLRSYRRILVTEGVRRQRLELAI